MNQQVSQESTKMVLPVSLQVPDNPYGGKLEEIIGQYILHESYGSFCKMLQEAKAYKRIGNILVDDEQIESLWMEEDSFRQAKELMQDAKQRYEFGMQELEKQQVEESYRPDYRVILNGNFPKRIKSQLTEEERELYHVQGLHDEQFDIYYDEEKKQFVTVYYDITTSNEYFYKFSRYLELMGKRKNIPLNHKVLLITFDRALLGIDTDQDISIELQQRALQEAQINPWYYFRELARIVPKDGGNPKKYELTIASYTYIWLYCQCINTFREQMRQSGKTFDMQHTGGYEYSIGSTGTKALIVHFKQEEAGKNRGFMIENANLMPKWAQLHNIKRTIKKGQEVWQDGAAQRVGNKVKEASNDWCRNILKAVAVGTTESSASQAGRGDTVPFVFGDEMNYINQIVSLLTAITYANSMASKLAEKAGRRFGMHFASTAGELTNKSGQIMYKMTHDDMCQWIPELLGYSYHDLIQYVNMSKKSMVFFSYQYNELGFAESDFDRELGRAPTVEEFMKDFLNRWNSGGKNSLFSTELMNRIRKVSQNQLQANYMFAKLHRFIYFPKVQGQSFEDRVKSVSCLHVGIDIAAGGGNDSSVMFAIDMETAEPVFAFRHNNLTLDDFAHLTIAFFRYLRELFPTMKIILSPELDGIGNGYLPILLKDPVIEPMLFMCLRYFNDAFRQGDLKFYNKKIDSRSYGTYGTRMNRTWDGQKGGSGNQTQRNWLTKTLLTTLIEKHPFVFGWDELFREMTTLVKTGSNERIEAARGEHDDCVMAMLHACAPIWNPWYRENIERFFNFHVDFMKIKHEPLTSHIIQTPSMTQEHFDIEGKLTYNIIERKNEYGEVWDEVHVTKIIHGERVELEEVAGLEALREDPEYAHDPKLLQLRLKPFPKQSKGLWEEPRNLLNRQSQSIMGHTIPGKQMTSLSVTGIPISGSRIKKSLI